MPSRIMLVWTGFDRHKLHCGGYRLHYTGTNRIMACVNPIIPV
jgi:hypothetical protein